MLVSEYLKKENNNLDIARLLCSTMVIVGHSYVLFPANGNRDLVLRLTEFTYSGAVAVKFFFFISGLLVTNSLLNKKSVLEFLISRFFRVMPALLLVILFTALLIGPIISSLSFNDYFHNHLILKYIKNNLLLKTAYNLPGVFQNNLYPSVLNGSLWSIKYEVGCYLCLIATFIIVRDNKFLLNIIGLVILVDSFFGNNTLFSWLGSNLEVTQPPILFVLGCLFAVNSNKISISGINVIALLILTFVFWKSNYNQLLFLFTVCYGLMWLCSFNSLKLVKLRYDISYGVYLWGFLVQQIISNFFLQKNFYNNILISILFAYILGFLSFYFLEQRAINIGKSVIFKLKSFGY